MTFRVSYCYLDVGKESTDWKGETESGKWYPRQAISLLCQLCRNTSGQLYLGRARTAALQLQCSHRSPGNPCPKQQVGGWAQESTTFEQLQIRPTVLGFGSRCGERGLKHAAFGSSYPLSLYGSNHWSLKASGEILVTKCSACAFYLEGQSHWGVIKPRHTDVCASRHFTSKVFLK